MSRIGKQKITVPSGVTATIALEKGLQVVKIKGPQGEMSREFRPEIKIDITNNEITATPTVESIFGRSLWGTYVAHLKNMVKGVTEGFKKVLIVEGIGFKVQLAGEKLNFSLGFSHPVEVKLPKGIKATAEKNVLTLNSFDKELLGQFAEKIVSLKKPEPYKGKGIKYEGQVIKIKQGKKTVS
ncbi:MAG: 50S ribosomal protein L6 [Parcubacteria group bacterium GW2011_GWF2_38_76]|nr:MAG: 50S ribosomal protein L6 [Parcubacteria group bacterium GW2011_GWF2_38_76]HBM45894.1 50S ribosomal protein L6 [Patescibacteria group bacterium]